MKMFCFKIQQNRTINKEFDFLRGEGMGDQGDPIYIFSSQLLLVNIWKCFLSNFSKIAPQMKTLTFWGGGRGASGLPFIDSNLNYYCFKFQQNRSINVEFDYFEVGRGPQGVRVPYKAFRHVGNVFIQGLFLLYNQWRDLYNKNKPWMNK